MAPSVCLCHWVLKINYLKPIPVVGEMELRSRMLEKGERKMIIGCRVLHGGIECANADAITVRVKAPT
jgi:hypothetical protein